MEKATYDKESIQALLEWAEKMLETGNYPKEKFTLDKSTTILDSKQYLTCMTSMISQNWEKATYIPVIHQLEVFKEKWENNKEE